MTQQGCLICFDVGFPEGVRQLIHRCAKGHRVVFSSEKSYGVHEGNEAFRSLEMREADVIVGQPDPQLISKSRRVRWVHLTSAGYERFVDADFFSKARQRGIVFTNSSTVYSTLCAEHVMAMLLAVSRLLPHAWREQAEGRRWSQQMFRRRARAFKGSNIVIVGFGAIGNELARLCNVFGADVVGVRRTPGESPFAEIRPPENLKAVITDADFVVNLLPGNSQNASYFSAELLRCLKSTAYFINIGRGTTVSQDDLLRALREGWFAGAYLDVTDPEPLPSDHPLWTEPNCFITPHYAGGHSREKEEIALHFVNNLKRFSRGLPLFDRII